jgi:hypothetical protein
MRVEDKNGNEFNEDYNEQNNNVSLPRKIPTATFTRVFQHSISPERFEFTVYIFCETVTLNFPSRAIIYKRKSTGGLLVETVATDWICQNAPLNFQHVSKLL